MANAAIASGGAEQVALELLGHVARAEGIDLFAHGSTQRAWILDTYAECLKTAWDPETRLKAIKPHGTLPVDGTVSADSRVSGKDP
jgi:hypothetical protein